MLIFKKTSTLAIAQMVNPQVLGTLAMVAVQQGVKGAGKVAEEVAGRVAGDAARRATEAIRSHLTDHSERLPNALATANDRAWKTIEIALGGKGFWDRFASAEDKGLRSSVQAFLESSVFEDDPGFLTRCLQELRQARGNGHLDGANSLDLPSLAEELEPLARFDDPEAILETEGRLVEDVAGELKRLGYGQLGRLLAITPGRGQPLLAMAVQYYFRRAIGNDEVLARELTWVKLVTIDQNLDAGFGWLAEVQERQANALEEALDGLSRVEGVTIEARDGVLTLIEDVRALTKQHELLYQDLTAAHSFSIRDDRERALLQEVKRRYRDLSPEQRDRYPSLGLDVARLEVAAGEFEAAFETAQEVADHQKDAQSRAEAHHAAHRAALELKDWDKALTELQQAMTHDARFALWPRQKYEVARILGAGAFGVAFLARNRYRNREVVLKTFEPIGIDRDPSTIFSEAHALDELAHPGIVRLIDCGFVDPEHRQRPYLELEYIEGSRSLHDQIEEHGPLGVEDVHAITSQLAEALGAAHQRGILHRDVKPANVLVRKTEQGWEVKVIDFGLALRRSLVQAGRSQSYGRNQSKIDTEIAGTLDYAAPEQVTRDRTSEVGPHSDVFSFGLTCRFALLGTTQPRARQITALPDPWPDLLDDCCDPEISKRPRDFAEVMERLSQRETKEPAGSLPTTAEPPRPRPVPVARSPFTNTLGMTMVPIEPGEFLMGSTEHQIETVMKQFPDLNRSGHEFEQPQHPVKITRPFYLAAHPVTVGQFRRFVDDEKSHHYNAGNDRRVLRRLASFYGVDLKSHYDAGYGWQNPGFPQSGDHPVVNVNRDDAVAFLCWLNDQEKGQGRYYRLPTEAEWEYACRAGGKGVYGQGDDPAELDRVAWYEGNSGRTTHPVGQKEKNPFHLYDMLGNAWEWCDDWFDLCFYQSSPEENPNNQSGSFRVYRGGSWSSGPGVCRPAVRVAANPSYRFNILGFRVAAVLV